MLHESTNQCPCFCFHSLWCLCCLLCCMIIYRAPGALATCATICCVCMCCNLEKWKAYWMQNPMAVHHQTLQINSSKSPVDGWQDASVSLSGPLTHVIGDQALMLHGYWLLISCLLKFKQLRALSPSQLTVLVDKRFIIIRHMADMSHT